jgi:hypothetical protein
VHQQQQQGQRATSEASEQGMCCCRRYTVHTLTHAADQDRIRVSNCKLDL